MGVRIAPEYAQNRVWWLFIVFLRFVLAQYPVVTPYIRKEHPSADGLTIPLAEREARFAFVVKRVIAVLPSDFEQVLRFF